MLPLQDETPTGVPPTTPPMAPPGAPPPSTITSAPAARPGPPDPMSESLGMPQGAASKPAVPPEVASNIHHGLMGRAVSALMGNPTDYQVDPNTGQTVAVPMKSKPGDIWRHIVAGAILGGAIGGNMGEGKGEGCGMSPTPLQRAFA